MTNGTYRWYIFRNYQFEEKTPKKKILNNISKYNPPCYAENLK